MNYWRQPGNGTWVRDTYNSVTGEWTWRRLPNVGTYGIYHRGLDVDWSISRARTKAIKELLRLHEGSWDDREWEAINKLAELRIYLTDLWFPTKKDQTLPKEVEDYMELVIEEGKMYKSMLAALLGCRSDLGHHPAITPSERLYVNATIQLHIAYYLNVVRYGVHLEAYNALFVRCMDAIMKDLGKGRFYLDGRLGQLQRKLLKPVLKDFFAEHEVEDTKMWEVLCYVCGRLGFEPKEDDVLLHLQGRYYTDETDSFVRR